MATITQKAKRLEKFKEDQQRAFLREVGFDLTYGWFDEDVKRMKIMFPNTAKKYKGL